jgi:antibiotic biosynthesis monooxygenase (ABM) superfamily enzyme
MTETIAEGPVTVVVTRRVKPGKEQDYEAWLSKLIGNAQALPGFLGTTIQRPSASGPREYTSIFRFDSVDNLRAFEESDLRRQAMLDVADFVEADAVWKKLTGFEVWFAAPPGTVVPQPSRFRMAIVMICVVYGLVLSLGALVAAVLSSAPMPLRLLVTITLEVFLMTYFLMPRLTRMLAWFIYPKNETKR